MTEQDTKTDVEQEKQCVHRFDEITEWMGNPDIPGGTFVSEVKRCRLCGFEE